LQCAPFPLRFPTRCGLNGRYTYDALGESSPTRLTGSQSELDSSLALYGTRVTRSATWNFARSYTWDVQTEETLMQRFPQPGGR
jgi:hypothetical protein